jgi:hypothetical protein
MHFVDNTSALAGFIKGTSKVEDSCAIFSIYHILLARLGVRHWAEHVESEGNCSDGPSRCNGDIEQAAMEGIDCLRIIATVPPIEGLAAEPLSQLLAACEAL